MEIVDELFPRPELRDVAGEQRIQVMGMIDIRMLLDRLFGHLQVDPEDMDEVQQVRAEGRALGKR